MEINHVRWKGVGPYYAMFPNDFALKVIKKYSNKGDLVLDPFAGRASSIFTAATLDRKGVGIEINPVGWIYGKTKLKPAPEARVLERLRELGEESKNSPRKLASDFFNLCFSENVLSFLLNCRENLNWRGEAVDRTLMAFLLIYLHGKQNQAFSNQMRQSKSMSPEYSIKWWKERQFFPPEIDPVDFLQKRIKWRYEKGVPSFKESKIMLGNSISVLKNSKKVRKLKFNLLFTSPPYFNVTNYHYDQWLRLWLLGITENASLKFGDYKNKFSSKTKYILLVEQVFQLCSELLRKTGIVYVRTDAREFTLETTMKALKSAFPKKKTFIKRRPFVGPTQTALFGDKSDKPGEIDIILI